MSSRTPTGEHAFDLNNDGKVTAWERAVVVGLSIVCGAVLVVAISIALH